MHPLPAFHRRALPLLMAAAALIPPAAAQSPSAADGAEHQVFVAAAAGLDPDDLSVYESGQAASVVALEPSPPWEVVLYLDTAVSSETRVRTIAAALADRLPSLLGEIASVEVVVADPLPRSILPPTRDLGLLLPALERLELRPETEDAIRRRRATFLARVREAAARSQAGNEGGRSPLEVARGALLDEIAMRREQHDSLLEWLSERSGDGPKALYLLSDPLADDPLDFYVPRVPGGAQLAIESAALPDPRAVAEVATASSWTLFPLVEEIGEEERDRALDYRPTEELPVGFRLRIGGDREGDEEEVVDLGLDQPDRDDLSRLGRSTGGSVVSLGGVADAVAQLDQRRRLSFRSAPALDRARPPFDLEVVDAQGEALLAPELSFHGRLPEAVSALRVRRALAGDYEGDDLEVEGRVVFDGSRVGVEESEVLVEADVAPEAGPLRVTIGLARDDELEPTVRHHEVPSVEPPPEGELWSWRSMAVLPPGTEAAVVLVEELLGDSWGVSFAELVDRRGLEEGEDRRPGSDAQIAGDKALRLVPEDPEARRGRVFFRAESRDDVSRVVFLLDGEAVAERDRLPYRARIDLGRTPRFREITAVAYDAEGFELDRDSLLVNEPPEAFWVRIVQPRPGRRVGPIDVVVDVKVPEGGALERIDLFWGADLEQRLTEPPWRGRVRIPVDRPEGYIRAEAHLVDGRVSEDVVLMNRPGFGTEIGVELVELYVVATDRDGEPVRGLPADAFRVLEEGAEQEIETVAPAGDLPLTVGLAIDTSSSLFVKMPSVRRAARSFARGLIADRDRAFLMEFGSEPRLVQPTTRDLGRVVAGIDSLEPYGTTPVWEAVVRSLEQLQTAEGRKALIVFYDGDDEDEDFSFRRSLRMARELRVPVYLIVLNEEAARTQGRSFSTRAFVQRLERIARAGGGNVYFVGPDQELTEIFQAISDELRSHYLITYYPRSAAGGPEWREVTVEVDRPGLSARTIEGYGELLP